MEFEQIIYEAKDRIAFITFNRPKKLNAFTGQMHQDMMTALDLADEDDDVRVVIFTGAGRAFCAGADISGGGFDAARDDIPRDVEHRDGGGILGLRLYDMKKPMIAAINGPAVGVGMTMTLPMDVRLASENARMGFVFTRRGIVPEACSTWFLPRIIGPGRAVELTVSGRIIAADEALEMGLVTKVLPPEKLMDHAISIAREIADNTSAISVALTRQMIWRGLGFDHPMQSHRLESKGVFATSRSEDAREGVSAFLEKRPAKFTLKPSSQMPEFYPWWEDEPFHK